MKLPSDIDKNLRFLRIEIDSQIENLQAYFESPGAARARRILDRRNYTYNLKSRIHTSSLKTMTDSGDNSLATLSLRCAELTATDLERIGELCRECIKRAEQVAKIELPSTKTFLRMLDHIRLALDMLAPAIDDSDTQKAMQIGQVEAELNREFQALTRRYISALKAKKKYAEDITTALLVAHNIEKMGDVLLNISENIVTAIIGQPLSLDRLNSLQSSISELEDRLDDGAYRIEPLAYSRSGSSVSGVRKTGDNANADELNYLAVFKEGEKRKLNDERKGVESWHEVFPGLAPRILSYKKRGQSASLLIEHLPGMTFQEILLTAPAALLEESVEQLGRTLLAVWQETRIDKAAASRFSQQLLERLPDVYRIHPEFRQHRKQIGNLKLPSFSDLLDRALIMEKSLKAPFSTYIHGDFNVDNIIYDPLEKRINFIDLHRSRHTDYVQDVSVFMVSGYRLQILDRAMRQRVLNVARDFYSLARQFAVQADDHSFELRLALGLVRSFVSSTRFTLDKTHARNMFLRARYLLESALNAAPDKPENFRIPVKEIFIA